MTRRLTYPQGVLLAKFTKEFEDLPSGFGHKNRTLGALIRLGFVTRKGTKYRLCDNLPIGYSVKHWDEK